MSLRNRPLASLLLMLLALLVVAAPAQAGRKWCQRDPIFTIGGTTVPVYVSVYDDLQSHVTGPIAVTLSVPKGVTTALIYVDDGFNGYGEVVSIVQSSRLKVTSRGIQIQVQVTVPADLSMPVLVTVAPATGKSSSVTGKTNTVVSVNTTVVPSA